MFDLGRRERVEGGDAVGDRDILRALVVVLLWFWASVSVSVCGLESGQWDVRV